MTRQFQLDLNSELIVDNFAGGGGASEGIWQALGRHVDVAINHNAKALAMHEVNHPQTHHLQEDVFEVDPKGVTQGRRVGMVWLSPDCRHHSRAKGGKPVEKKVRGLAWVALKWAGQTHARVICLENVVEIQGWGPLVAMRDKASGRVLRNDGSVAPKGEQTPVSDQMLRADVKHSGKHFNRLVARLRAMGYVVEFKELVACDYGVPTTRRRLFLIARNDGRPIEWPAQTHADPKSLKVQAKKLKPWRTAAECLDFDINCPSVFLSKDEGRLVGAKRPLAEATMARVGKGVLRYVVQAAKPFLVKAQGGAIAGASLATVGYGERKGQSPRVPAIDEPLGTVVAGAGKHALVTALMIKHYGGVVGFGLHGEPMHTVTATDHHSLVLATLAKDDANNPAKVDLEASSIMKMRGTNVGHATDEPLHTVSAQGTHFAEIRALLTKCAGSGFAHDPTLVRVKGETYQITDIGMRMLKARELFRAMSFPESYVIGNDASQGLSLTQEQQIRMVGNSVPPLLVKAIVMANCADLAVRKAA
jgi:DNA (cytosine-5)-methyltransferase 1